MLTTAGLSNKQVSKPYSVLYITVRIVAYLAVFLLRFRYSLRLCFCFACRMSEEVPANGFYISCYDSMQEGAPPDREGPLPLTPDSRKELDPLKREVRDAFFPNLNLDQIRCRLKLMYWSHGAWWPMDHNGDVVEALETGTRRTQDTTLVDDNDDVVDALESGTRRTQDATLVSMKANLRPYFDLQRLHIQCQLFYPAIEYEHNTIGGEFPAADLPDMTLEALRTHVSNLVDKEFKSDFTKSEFDHTGRELTFYDAWQDADSGRVTYDRIETQTDLLDVIHNLPWHNWIVYVEIEGFYDQYLRMLRGSD